MKNAQVYERKQILVSAIQVTEENIHIVAEWCGRRAFVRKHSSENGLITLSAWIPLAVKALIGDWIVKDEHDEFHTYTPAMFKRDYKEFKKVETNGPNSYGEIDCRCNRCGHIKLAIPFIICDNFGKCGGCYEAIKYQECAD